MTENQIINFNAISERVHAFCEGSGKDAIPLPQVRELIKDILNEAFADAGRRDEYLNLLTSVQNACAWTPERLGAELDSLALTLYTPNEPEFAYWVYQQAVRLNSSRNSNNNLAYISRHHRNLLTPSAAELIDLLMDGVKQREPFSLINMALVFGQMLGTEEDWLLADRMIRLIDPESVMLPSAVSWWSDLADQKDPEGHLILQWLKRNGRLPTPLPLSRELELINFESKADTIPKWIFEEYKEA